MEKNPRMTATAASIAMVVMVLTAFNSRKESVNKVTNFFIKKLPIWRVLAAKFVVMLVCNVILTTLCLTVLYGQAFMVILPARALKNLIMWPIDSVIFFAITKALEQIGLFRMFQKPVLTNSANMQGN